MLEFWTSSKQASKSIPNACPAPYVTYKISVKASAASKRSLLSNACLNSSNSSLIKLKDKLNKRLLPIEVIEGHLENEIISVENDEIGKVLIKDSYPYAIIKVKNEKFDFDKTFNCGSAKVKIKKPDWLQIT